MLSVSLIEYVLGLINLVKLILDLGLGTLSNKLLKYSALCLYHTNNKYRSKLEINMHYITGKMWYSINRKGRVSIDCNPRHILTGHL